MEYTNIRATANNNNENTHFSPPHLSFPHHKSNSQVSPTFSPLPYHTTPILPPLPLCSTHYSILLFLPTAVVLSIGLKSTNSFLQAEERSPSLSFSLSPPLTQFFPFHPSETWILSPRVRVASYKNLHKHHQRHDPLLFSFFLAPTALRRLTNKCITHPYDRCCSSLCSFSNVL